MSALERTRKVIVGDLTRTRHMLAVSAVIMGATFMPIVGGPIEAYEIAEVRQALSGQHDTAIAAPAVAVEPVQDARPERASARVQEVALTPNEAELTTLALDTDAEPEPALRGDEMTIEPEAEVQELDTLPTDETELEILDDEPVVPNA
jgi:hypothetical protein